MTAAHTPGPWEHVGSGVVRSCRNEDGTGGFQVADCFWENPRHKHDAELIAAAPELLSTLEWALSGIGPMNRGDYYERAVRLVERAKGCNTESEKATVSFTENWQLPTDKGSA